MTQQVSVNKKKLNCDSDCETKFIRQAIQRPSRALLCSLKSAKQNSLHTGQMPSNQPASGFHQIPIKLKKENTNHVDLRVR